jgi:hypothetical protein
MLVNSTRIIVIVKLLKEIFSTIETYLDRNQPTLSEEEKPE